MAISVSSNAADAASRWQDAFIAALLPHEVADPLKQAAIGGRLADWTRHLTAVVVKSCESIRWRAAAKGFPLRLLPQVGQEYLGMDLMAFQDDGDESGMRHWRFPTAVFELENSRDDDRVAYSLWKVLCVRAGMRVVFAYRQDWDQARNLIRHLMERVVGTMPIDEREALTGRTMVVLGSRGEGETFPHGYFKMWRLDTNLGRFEKA
jgi:hypothetical protein